MSNDKSVQYLFGVNRRIIIEEELRKIEPVLKALGEGNEILTYSKITEVTGVERGDEKWDKLTGKIKLFFKHTFGGHICDRNVGYRVPSDTDLSDLALGCDRHIDHQQKKKARMLSRIDEENLPEERKQLVQMQKSHLAKERTIHAENRSAVRDLLTKSDRLPRIRGY